MLFDGPPTKCKTSGLCVPSPAISMKDFQTIFAEYQKTDWTLRKGAIATVVKVHGSSYRSPGARMLIFDDGRWVGSISGGCLEGDALRKARKVMNEQRPMTVTYDTREESNQNLGIGLGCNGVIDVLIQPLQHALPVIQRAVEYGKPVALATVFNGDACGHHLLINERGDRLSCSDDGFGGNMQAELMTLFSSRKSFTRQYDLAGENVPVFLELIQPAPHLILYGGGFDARPVSQLAKSLGWRVEVTDECVAHIAPVFFPDADRLALCQREFIDRDFPITPYTACVLMSHNYEYDRDVLKKLLDSEAPYIGILGPRKRFTKMMDEFREQGVIVTPAHLHRIHSPIGLDIGAEAPDEIAVSIIAEIQARFASRSGGFLKYHEGPIHQRTVQGEVLKQVFLADTDPGKKRSGT
jgi:xanthine dehydrogenase accessory factor